MYRETFLVQSPHIEQFPEIPHSFDRSCSETCAKVVKTTRKPVKTPIMRYYSATQMENQILLFRRSTSLDHVMVATTRVFILHFAIIPFHLRAFAFSEVELPELYLRSAVNFGISYPFS